VKAKVSVTVDSQLVARAVRLGKGRTRSEIFELALAAWVRSRRHAALADEIERYYRDLSDAERHEDETWARAGEEALRRAE
jgi:Arc/MetJ family transcription regulator